MTVATTLAVPNSLLLVMDPTGAAIPESMNNQLVVSTPGCIAVGTLAGADGRTKIVLTDEMPSCSGNALQTVFQGVLATPSKEVHVSTVLLRPVATIRVPTALTSIEVLANHNSEPDELFVLVNKGS